MATSSILGGERAPITPKGTDAESLGPSDSSDSGSDAVGDDRAASEGGLELPTDADILPDRIGVIPEEAGRLSDVDDPESLDAQDLAVEDGDDEEDEGDDAVDAADGERR